MKIKDFFYFSRNQRVGIIILLLLILLAMAGTFLMPYFLPKGSLDTDNQFISEVKSFENSLRERENKWSKKQNFQKGNNNYYSKETYSLFLFDPNTADSATFVKLGIKPYIAKNILKYRNKGGKFKSTESFAKVYGITPEKFEELKPYISIKEDNRKISKDNKEDRNPATSLDSDKKQNIILELNSADTAELRQIKGIGTSFAKRIVGYRKVLGGYYSVEQLKEVYGIKPEMYEQIRSSFTVNSSDIHKINVNTASIERLKSHPYIKTFQRARDIYEYRRKKVKLKSMDDLKELSTFTDDELKKLGHYLVFN